MKSPHFLAQRILGPRLARLALVLCALAVFACSLDRHAGAAAAPPDQPIPASYFSMNILFHPLNHVPWPSVPLGGWRLSHVNWADLEPERGVWKFDLLDKYVGWSQQHHLEILMALTYTPRWASSTPDAPTDVEANNPPGLSGAPRDIEDWKTFVRLVSTRYKGRIRNWEIWNEPNRPQSWTGTVDQMVDLAREAYTILKQADPGCTVVSPAPTGPYGLRFFDAYLAKGGGRFADVIGYHFYVARDAPPEAMATLIGSVEKTLDKYGLAGKPLWNTEAGWLGPDMFPPQTQAAYLARAYLLNWASGVTRFYWYAWEDHHGTRVELVGPDNATLTPAGKALATVESWLTGARLTHCAEEKTSEWTCDLSRDGRQAHVLWNTAGDTPIDVPSAWQAHQALQLDGSSKAIDGKSISVGIAPELVQ